MSADLVGRTFGHYRVTEQIGAGGMGVVYRARDERLERDVALKVLPAGSFNDASARSRFRKEALVLARLNHPHIGAVYDFGTDGDLDFLVMEYVAGTTLATQLVGTSLPEREAIAIGAQIARALEDAHELGVVHRDLKPGNIMVTPKGQAKVLDFGLARTLDQVSGDSAAMTVTETKALIGTPAYMAPEQLHGHAADTRSDVHALGTVLYEMATGRRAFPEDQQPVLFDAILNRVPVSPRALNSQLSEELERIVLKCLEKDPDRRYQSAREVAIDLERMKTGPQVAAKPRRVSRRVAVTVGGLAVVGIAVALGLGVWGWRGAGSDTSTARIQSLAVLPLDNVSGNREQEYFADGMTDALINELSRISALTVISRTSVMPYKGARKPLREIASELGVDGIIEGSVLQEGDQVRITLQLIHGATDRNVWSDSYQREVRSVLALQNDVARAVAREIQVTLTPQDETRLAGAADVNRDAYDAYLKGLQLAGQDTEDGHERAIEQLETATGLDPRYAPAHAQLAWLYAQFFMGGSQAPRELYPKAKAAALKALELDDTESNAYVALAAVTLYYDWDWTQAAGHYQKAIALNPSNAQAHQAYGSYLQSLGRFDEAFAERALARTLDPLSAFRVADVGYPLYLGGRYDQALGYFRSALEMDSRFFWAHLWIGQVLVAQGKHVEAIAEIERAAGMSNRNTRVIATLGHAYGRAGRSEDAKRVLAELNTRGAREYVSSFYMALVYVGLSMDDRALEELEKAVGERQPFLMLLNVEPTFLALRSNPRFQRIVERIGIPSAAR